MMSMKDFTSLVAAFGYTLQCHSTFLVEKDARHVIFLALAGML